MAYTRLTGGTGTDGAYQDGDEWDATVANQVRDDLDDHESRVGTVEGAAVDHETRIATQEARPSAGLILLASQTAAASASLDFVTRNAPGQSGAIFQSDYDEYVISFVNIAPATDDASFRARVTTDGGASWSSSAVYQIIEMDFRSSTNFGEASASNSGTQFDLVGNLGNDSIGGLIGELKLYGPRDGSVYPTMVGWINFFHSGLNRCVTFRSFTYGAAVPIDGLQFYFSAGNIASGSIRIYGIAK